MNSKEARELIIKYSRPYRNATEGLMVSVSIFDLVQTADAGTLFDAVIDHAERLLGCEVDVAPAQRGWLRIIPKRDIGQLMTIQ